MKDSDFSGIACYSLKRSVASSFVGNKLKCFVLESDPTPDYYAKNNFPENKHSHSWSLYFPIKNPAFCFQDIILRNAAIINKKLNSSFSILPGQMTISNKTQACIRIRSQNIEQLPQLITEFKELDIHFFSTKEIKQYQSIIYYKKYTEFVKIGDGIFQNRNDENHYFFEVPRLINFDEFLKGMERIKNNCNYHLFDSFLTSIFLKDYTQDFIGIYSEHCDKSRFGELAKEIEKVFHI